MRNYTHNAAIPLYHDGTFCPACTMNNWLIGRQLAECAKCGYTLVLGHQYKGEFK
jgi:hypothetical protein